MYEPMNTLLFRAISSQAEGQYQSSANSVLTKQEMFAQKHKVATGKLVSCIFMSQRAEYHCVYYNHITIKFH